MITLLSGHRGSYAHGTQTEGSDLDTFSIVAMPIEYYFGLKNFECDHRADDHLIYDIRKFVKLLIKANPSALELLFTKTLVVNLIAKELVNNRSIFLSKAIVTPVLGHCKSTLARRTDGKGYAHCIRLLRMAREVLNSGSLIVNRTGLDAEFLKDVKNGVVEEEFCLSLIRHLESQVKELEKTSTLQESVPVDKAERILVNILGEVHGNVH